MPTMTPVQTPTTTPLQEIEESLHDHYRETAPTEEQARDYILQRHPQMDGGAAAAIALAGLVLQGWQVYRAERDRYLQAKGKGGDNKCPECNKPELSKNTAGKSVCENKHIW